MALRAAFFGLAATGLWPTALGEYVWPSPRTDELEALLYQQVGFRSNGIIALLGTGDGKTFHCRGLPFVKTGQSLGAEWIRNAYHDMATHDIVAGTGGMDASIALEIDRPENVGSAFQETAGNVLTFSTTRSSGADLFALAAVMALGVCSNGTVIVPLKAGRVDATAPGPSGVPKPEESLESHTASFARQGFNATEMIGLVACGHSVGGVHGVDFPQIVDIVNDTRRDDNTVGFDSSIEIFDNRVATEFVANTSQNPLAFGHNETTRSDFRIFNADGGDLISKMAASPAFFLSTCNSLLERMLNTVPRGVELTDVIAPVPVKPLALSMDMDKTGNNLTISGTIRFDKTLLPASNEVRVHFSPRDGADCTKTSCLVVTASTSSGMESTCAYPNCGPPLKGYIFTATAPVASGVSAFIVEVVDTAMQASTFYDNSGHKFPLPDTVLPSASRSCSFTSTQTTNMTALIYNADRFTNVSLIVPEQANLGVILPHWVPAVIAMQPAALIPGTNYTLFTANYTALSGATRSPHPYDLVAVGPDVTAESTFNSFAFGTCA
ncbi:heme peroxidase [Thozetella sp. PMI_491]|nr:heme peroxidase [Thozetella sp. PMI_491]